MDPSLDGSTFVREVEIEKNGWSTRLSIHQMKVGDVGCVVWDAALVLGYYLQAAGAKFVANQNVIELGSGTGVVGLIAAIGGAKRVILTDLPELLPLLNINIKANASIISGYAKSDPDVHAFSYRWGNDQDFNTIVNSLEKVKLGEASHNFSCVLVADCVYYGDAIEPLASTIFQILSTGRCNTNVLCAYEDREVGDKAILQEKFRNILTCRYGLTINYIPTKDMHPVFCSDDIHIMHISMQPKS